MQLAKIYYTSTSSHGILTNAKMIEWLNVIINILQLHTYEIKNIAKSHKLIIT